MSKTPITDKNTVGYPQGEFVPARISKELETQLTAAKEKIAEQEAQIKALRKAVVCAEVALLDTAPCARADCNQEQKPVYDIAIAAIDAARKK